MPEEKPQDPPAPVRRTRYQKQAEPGSVGLLVGGAITLTLAAGVVLVLVGGALTPTQGARASTRLEWVERRAELDRIAAQAEADGKLRR